MPAIHLITGTEMPVPDPESHLLVEALERHGADARMVRWREDDAVGADADVVVIRTPWDYTEHRREFAEWCRRASAHAPLLNPPATLEWNGHKGYLVELAERGVPVVPTLMVTPGGERTPVPAEWAETVIKPAVSSGSRGAGRFASGDPAADAHLAGLLASGDALIQPFAPSVSAGERSLIFFDRVFSHAVNKTPAAGDYRVQEYLGGTRREHQPTGAERAAAQAALAAVEGDLLYARVDLVDLDGAPVLMELEVIEPELFLGVDREAPDRLARAILTRV